MISKGAATREAIVAAAEDLLLESASEQAVSIRAVADAVGLTPPAIYRHFPDKHHLIFEVCNLHFTRMAEEVAATVGTSGDPLEAIAASARSYARFGLENPEHYRVMFMGHADHTPELYADEKVMETGSFAFLVAQQGGAAFGYPSIFGRGCPAPLTNNVTQTRVGGGSASGCDLRSVPVPTTLNNVAVPGMQVVDVFSNTASAVSTYERLQTFFLGGQTPWDALKRTQPTFVSIELGANDVLGALLASGNPGKPPPLPRSSSVGASPARSRNGFTASSASRTWPRAICSALRSPDKLMCSFQASSRRTWPAIASRVCALSVNPIWFSPSSSTSKRCIAPVWTSLTKMSKLSPLPSSSTRLPAALRKAMKRPSSEIEAPCEAPSPRTPRARRIPTSAQARRVGSGSYATAKAASPKRPRCSSSVPLRRPSAPIASRRRFMRRRRSRKPSSRRGRWSSRATHEPRRVAVVTCT